MALITWSDSMSVGVGRIDKEHQGLIDLIILKQDMAYKLFFASKGVK